MRVLTPELFEAMQPHEYVQSTTKTIQINWLPATYQLSWGVQNFPGPHVQILNQGPVYGVALREFFNTHVPVEGDNPLTFRKDAVIRAVRLSEPVLVQTFTEDGNLEAKSTAPIGSYVIKNPGENDYYTNTPEQFEESYVLAS